MKILRRIEVKNTVIEDKESIRRENIVIKEISKIISKYLGKKLSKWEKGNIVEFVETL